MTLFMNVQPVGSDNPNFNPNLMLCEAIASLIAASPGRRITFAEYMDQVLYHPELGYYATNQAQIGASGDFFTAPHLGADLGELLAEQFVELWHLLNCPQPFTLVEMGAGQGILAADILQYLPSRYPDFFEAVEYIIIEKSVALKAEQKQQIQNLPNLTTSAVQWCEWEQIANSSITGCFFSNELVDALPVHQVLVRNQQLQEIYVSLAEHKNSQHNICSEFIEIEAELSTPKLREYFELVGIDLQTEAYPDGYRTEVNLAALDWITTVAQKLHQGFVLTIDYGYPAQRYYSPTRTEGTLQCYFQHRHHNNPYINVGRQDITAHVDFTALQRQGELWGLEAVGFTQQALFLMALGLGERIATVSQTPAHSLSEILQRREALHSLINPMGMGQFGVLIQSKRLSQTPEEPIKLRGLTTPPLGLNSSS